MDVALIDNLVIAFSFVYYAMLIVVYLLRAHELTELELRMSPAFSSLLIPFASLWALNILNGNDIGRIITMLPMVIYLLYDLWYRAITKKKPPHHPDQWPIGLIVYLLLLFSGSIGLNWYGYMVSDFHGSMLVIAFFVMMGSFGYYQLLYNRRKKPKKDNSNQILWHTR